MYLGRTIAESHCVRHQSFDAVQNSDWAANTFCKNQLVSSKNPETQFNRHSDDGSLRQTTSLRVWQIGLVRRVHRDVSAARCHSLFLLRSFRQWKCLKSFESLRKIEYGNSFALELAAAVAKDDQDGGDVHCDLRLHFKVTNCYCFIVHMRGLFWYLETLWRNVSWIYLWEFTQRLIMIWVGKYLHRKFMSWFRKVQYE